MVDFCAFFDLMDGKVARSLGGDSAFGMEFDSLADIVSFGVVPGLIFYVSYLYAFGGVLGALVISFYVLCGALRLARFNVVRSSGNFQGLPIPAAGLFLVSFVISVLLCPINCDNITTMCVNISASLRNIKQLSKNNINVLRLLFRLVASSPFQYF